MENSDFTVLPPPAGNAACFGGYTKQAATESTSQMVKVPVDSEVLLSFWVRVNIVASNTGPADFVVPSRTTRSVSERAACQ